MLTRWRLAWINGFPPCGWLTVQYERALVGEAGDRFRARHAPSDGIGRTATHSYPCVPVALAEAHAADLQALASGDSWTRSATGNQWGQWRPIEERPAWAEVEALS